MPRANICWDEIQQSLKAHAAEGSLTDSGERAQLEKVMMLGFLPSPLQKKLIWRGKYFSQVQLRGFDELPQASREQVLL